MEPLNILENGNITQKKKFPWCQVAFNISVLALVMISALVSVIFCLLHHKQAPGPCWAHGSLNKSHTQNPGEAIRWEWNLQHCDGFVRKEKDRYLLIEKSGNYFVYAQINRRENITDYFTLMLYKEPGDVLNKAVGPAANDSGTVSFGRPFFLQKGDQLYCRANIDMNAIPEQKWSYWGLYKI